MTTYFVADTAALTGRTLRHVMRSVDTVITTAIMPVAMMAMFVYVFGGAIDTGAPAGARAYIDYMLPGIVLITVASSVAYTSYRLFMDTKNGIFERFRAMPIARSGVLWAHVLTSLVATMISVVLVVATALVMGFRSSASVSGWLAVAGIVLLFTLAMTWVAVIAGLSANSVEGASAFSYPLIFLPFVSSAFVPTDTMPGPVRAFAEHQPVTSIVDAMRSLWAHEPVGGAVWIASAWCVGLLVAAFVVATMVFRRRSGGR